MSYKNSPRVHVASDVVRKQTLYLSLDTDFQPESGVELVEIVLTIPVNDRRPIIRRVTVSADNFSAGLNQLL